MRSGRLQKDMMLCKMFHYQHIVRRNPVKKSFVIALAALIACFFVSCDKMGAKPKETVKVDFHIMSQCPFGVQVDTGIKPVLDKLGNAVEFNRNFIGQVKEDGTLTSMHGENEVKGNLLQICAAKHFPKTYMNLVACMNKEYRKIPENFDACATEAKIDGAKIKACADGEEGKALLKASYDLSKEKGATGSPTIFINGERYKKGGRTENDFLRNICEVYKPENKPEPCKAIPAPKKVDLTVLTDARCTKCVVDPIVNQMKNIFPGLVEKKIDYGTEEGKKLYETLKATEARLLPAFLFDKNVTEDPGFQQVQRWMLDVNDKKMLRVGGKFDPTAEICDNQQDDTGDGKIDCADDTCKGNLVCREEKKDRLDLFVMSQCPYGTKALDAMKEVLKAFGNKIDFHVNYIATETGDGKFNALHGQPEVDENIRQLCAIKHYPKNFKYMDYIWCRNPDIRSAEWQKCAVNGIDAKVIEKCSTGDEGKKLHSENIKIANSLEIGASPTWLANNKNKFSGIAPEDIKKQFCQYNPGKKGCEQTLSNDAGAMPKGGGCGK